MNRFDNKVVLVTGGRTGIGRAIVELFQAEGARVFSAQRTPDEQCESIVADFAVETTASNVVNAVIENAGRLDVLINNAGVMFESSVEACATDTWNTTLMVNLTTPFLLIKHALPYLKGGGAIVNIGSIEGFGANPMHSAYCASKAGLHGLTRAVAVDHGKDAVRCNAVAPGWINTDLNEDFIESMPDPIAFRKNIGNIHPVGKTGEPEEVASLVVYLASDDAKFITGQVITVDGGRMAQLSLPS